MGKSEAEIIKARQHGAQVHELYFDPLIAFTGDTQIEFLDQCDWIKKVRVLMMEVTYIDSSKTVAQAREWGHIHLDEVLPRLSELECEKIIFTHLSSRHRLNGAEKYLREQLPARERNRVEFFVG